jgi:hypothetical protein
VGCLRNYACCEFIDLLTTFIFSSDGTPVNTANPIDQQKLLKATIQYKNALDTTEKRDQAAKKLLIEARSQAQKCQTLVKQAQRAAVASSTMLRKKKVAFSDAREGKRTPKLSEAAEAEKSSTRVKEVVSALRITADKRRDQLNQKRSSSTSSTWVQTLPGLSGPLRKSLWHKMHRRRQQIVLRPSLESLVSDLRSSVLENLSSSLLGRRAQKADQKPDWADEELVKAEQLFLLAVHPVAPEELLPSVPPSNSNESWAEPGTWDHFSKGFVLCNKTRSDSCIVFIDLMKDGTWHLTFQKRTEHIRCFHARLSFPCCRKTFLSCIQPLGGRQRH